MSAPVPFHDDATIDPTGHASRLKLVACRLTRVPGGRSSVTVEFSLPGDEARLVRTIEATSSPAGDLRLAALATLEAIATATNGAFTAELIGAKPVRAFDATIMVVAMIARVDNQQRQLIGAAIADADQVGSVALATLQAVNRVVSPLLVRQIPPG